MDCLSKIGDCLSEENFTYIKVYGCYDAPHDLPLYNVDKLLCRKVSYQTTGIGIEGELRKDSKKS